MTTLVLLGLASLALGSVTIVDPSNYADLAADTADNALLANYWTDNGGPQELIYNITGPYYFSATDGVALAHQVLSVDANDTSVVVITEDSAVNLSYVTVVKEGYATWLNQASFFGVNAAVNVANASTAYIDHSNITVHDGAANIYAYGTGSAVYVSDVDLYSSGPVSHGLYAAGNGTIYANNIRHYSGGNRASSFSGDNPGGYLYVTDAVAHTAGIGSATFYTLGKSYGTDVVGRTDQAPSVFSDGAQSSVFVRVDLTAGLLAGTVLFCSADRQSGAELSFTDSRLTTLGSDMAALWFGNVIADVQLVATEINTTSGILVIANSSQVTQAFDYFAGSEENSAIQPAEVTVLVEESDLRGDLVAYNGSSIAWTLASYSSWTGTAYSATGKGYLGVYLDETSTWTLTDNVELINFTNGDSTHSNIISGGYNISYDVTADANAYLDGTTVSLSGGGILFPY
ncbi:hypothetical protein ASPZODRAFT_142097 [Penicilliopsis zonata CBS 506.65]|uniref:Right handed beta helix domain-containing protein n=1 Tax=Penicilliopsis zonata CBS 506.65 TaxID=1073090 RepID=A0A1L9SJU0_9EURO|nr:hypothetical protein ASPZODRAFT_142097 [Penicilliopsis zonata CBS 506.65]OJJ47363.1 hypothetical protein ASPZODRAFT_142097 [Penicilliopsis zonata CBS 506.65]